MNLDIKLHNEDLPDELTLSDNIAVDCEFMGLNVERDGLCLVQISTGKDDAHIVKLNRENYNAPNLKKILINEKINKIFHFARADLLFIKKYLKVDVENVNCTKIMSKLARSYSDKHGLKDLVK
ncbi:ribonuclease D, partial [Candidatus Pelagibacter sp.]|nr:ribonuclease D [Candidatus Pelagibacter sp.]